MTVAIVVPWRDGCPARERAWQWIRARYAERHPEWEIIEATAPSGPWIKAFAVNPAVERCDADVVVLADADVWCDRLSDAVEAVEAGSAWAIPHWSVHRLTDDSTAAFMTGADPRTLTLTQPSYRGVAGGGILVARRETLIDIPLDPRFVGWGREDQSHAIALHYLGGPAWRGHTGLYHLWHPPQDRPDRKRGAPASEALIKRYLAARRSPDAMRSLIEEAKHAALHLDQPSMHHHQAV